MDQDYRTITRMRKIENIYRALTRFRSAEGEEIHQLSDNERKIIAGLRVEGLI